MRLEKAHNPAKKWRAVFNDGTHTEFGATGYDDFTKTKNIDQRTRYRIRHHKDLKTGNPKKAGFLSYYLLWGNSTSLAQNVKEYNQRFNV